jgi:hypothetical protein
VEERLRFYEEGVAPTKNLTAMQEVLKQVGLSGHCKLARSMCFAVGLGHATWIPSLDVSQRPVGVLHPSAFWA